MQSCIFLKALACSDAMFLECMQVAETEEKETGMNDMPGSSDARGCAGGIPLWLGLGSNSPDAMDRLDRARDALRREDGLLLVRESPVYKTEPQDYADQPFFHNQVLELKACEGTHPVRLMQRLLEIEAALGRVRSKDPALRYGPRAIDIDMLLFGAGGAYLSSDPVCLLPHPRLVQRAFWLVPLRDIAPGLTVQGENISTLLDRLAWSMRDMVIYQETDTAALTRPGE